MSTEVALRGVPSASGRRNQRPGQLHKRARSSFSAQVEFAPTGERSPEGDLVGKLEVAAHGQA